MTAAAVEEAAVASALGRAATYRLLAAAFAYPTRERLSDLARQAGEAARAPAAGLESALARFTAAAGAVDAPTLAGEYVRLFERAVPCPPYEGAWGPQQMSGKAALLADIAGFYAAFGVAPAPQHPDIEDHVGAELEFMSVLALKEAHALAEGHGDGVAVTRHAQATFLSEHLARWADAFAARVRALAAPGFYAAAAALLAAWIDRECVTLSATPTKVDVPAPAEDAPLSCPMADAPEDHH